MKIALISHLYPNRAYPASGTFIRENFLGLLGKVDPVMLVPTVRAVPFTQRWRYTHTPFNPPNEAIRLRYLSFPNRRFPHLIQRNISAALLSYLKNNRVDLVHVNWLFPDGLAIPALKKEGFPVILTIHGSDWYKTRGRPSLEKLLHHAMKQADLILTVGTKLRNDIIAAHPGLENKIQVTHNSVDFGKFTPPGSRNEALAELSWHPDKKHLLCVANFSREKGVDILEEAYRQLKRRDTMLHVIGNIPDEAYARDISARLARLDSVICHPPVPHDRIATYYRACDLFVLPSRSEGFGISLAEAIACGKPVVSTKSGGPEEIVNDKNGFLVEPGNPEQLALKMEEVLDGNFTHSSDKIRNSIRNKFSSDKLMDERIAIYKQIVTQPPEITE